MKKTLAILLCTLMLISCFTGCGSKSEAEPAPADDKSVNQSSESVASEDSVEIVYWQQVRHDNSLSDFEALAEEFHKLYPNVTVKVEEIAPNDIGTKVETAIMGNTQPDVLMDSMMRMSKYAYAGLLADCSDLYENFNDVFISSLADMVTFDDKLIGLPGTYNPYGVLVNVDLFREAGAEDLIPADPERTWTREEFEAALAAVTTDTVTGTAFFSANESSDVDTKTMIEGGQGFTLFADDYSKVNYNETRGVEGVAWINSLIEKGLAVKGAEGMVDDDAWELFAQQKIAVLPANLWCRSWIEGRVAAGELEGFEIRYVQYPHVDGDTPKTPINCVVFSVFDKGDALKVKYGKLWAQFVIESEAEKACNIAQNAFSAQLSRADLFAEDPENTWIAETLMKYGYDPGYACPAYQDCRLLLYPELQAVFSGQKTAEKAMNDFADAANALLQ